MCLTNVVPVLAVGESCSDLYLFLSLLKAVLNFTVSQQLRFRTQRALAVHVPISSLYNPVVYSSIYTAT